MSKLKVYGGLTTINGKQARTIIAATSMASAAEAVVACTGDRVPPSRFRNYWVVSGNHLEMTLALGRPGVVFRASPNNRYELKELKPILVTALLEIQRAAAAPSMVACLAIQDMVSQALRGAP